MSEEVKMTDGFIVLNPNGHYEYSIELDRCKNTSQVLSWVCQLSDMNWVTTSMIREFIKLARLHNKIYVPPLE